MLRVPKRNIRRIGEDTAAYLSVLSLDDEDLVFKTGKTNDWSFITLVGIPYERIFLLGRLYVHGINRRGKVLI